MSQPIQPGTTPRRDFILAVREHRTPAQPFEPAARAASMQEPASVERTIADASDRTGIDFRYLVAQARVESSMNPAAKARTSSAAGLYQFIESTWLETMKSHGSRFGLGEVSSKIGTSRTGAAHVADPAQRKAILDLRSDPQIASLMAAGLAQDNRAHLAPILGREPDHGELYLAHFLGAEGAGKFLSAMADNPQQSAAALFRKPASANRAIFFEANGAPRSLEGVMQVLSAKLERAMPEGGAPAAAPPYLIADEAVFEPHSPPTITRRGNSVRAPDAPLSLPTAPRRIAPAKVPPMSATLRATFGSNAPGRAGEAAQRIERAYEQLRSFGL
ncbi:transglycosylase SLT domain-containing protein [Erythrobacter sp. THAF29]|uniref:transglycosylase SLT domain-containing protein n=1 Tax=Erythrobacter sp. THAF29 TaxID=2587851 RepID=UPI0012682286|nr:transglycosylase SLT domain-containing protein [Erythrobacter sp. THAF29]QFT76680.1 hypothetical protein FIU90_03890 [Erythrobacter sp. THAF29]